MSGLSYIKKILCACLCVVAVACNKSSTVPHENDKPVKSGSASAVTRKYPVHFNMGNVEIPDARTANKEMPIRNYMHYLYYAAYDSLGVLASKIVQDSNASLYVGPEFGIIKDSLAAGHYTIFTLGTWYNRPGIGGDSFLTTLNVYMGDQDVFFKKFEINVSEKDTVTAAVKLTRLNGQLQVDLRDSLHPEVRRTLTTVDNVPSRFAVLTNSFTFYSSLTFPVYGSLAYPYKCDFSVTGSDVSHNVTISAYGDNDQILAQKVISGVYVYTNRKTILTGKIFSASESGRSAESIKTLDGTIIQKF